MIEQVAVEVHGALGLACRAGGEAQQGYVVAPGPHGVEAYGLVERNAVELGVVVGGAVEVDDLLQVAAVLGAGHQLVGDAAVAQGERNLGLVDDLGELAGAQQRHGVDGDRAGLRDRQPRRHHGRVVARPQEHAVAGLHAEILHQRVRQPVRPVGQLLVGAAAAVADQRGVVAEALLDHAVGQLHGGVEVLGILELGPVEQEVGPLLGRREVVAREGVDVGGGAQGGGALGCGVRGRAERSRGRTCV